MLTLPASVILFRLKKKKEERTVICHYFSPGMGEVFVSQAIQNTSKHNSHLTSHYRWESGPLEKKKLHLFRLGGRNLATSFYIVNVPLFTKVLAPSQVVSRISSIKSRGDKKKHMRICIYLLF